MNIFKAETDSDLIIATDLPESRYEHTAMMAKVKAYRHISLEELATMSMQDLVGQLKAGTRATIFTSDNRFVGLMPTGVDDYIIDKPQKVDIDELRKQIRLHVTKQSVQLNSFGNNNGPRVKDSYVLDMPYPVFAHYTVENGDTIIAFKVPSHKQYFNAPSYKVSNFEYQCPALVFVLRVTRGFNVIGYAVRMLRYDTPLLKVTDTYHLPLPNIFWGDNICVGSSVVDDQRKCSTIGEACMLFVAQFLCSNWRNDLSPQQMPVNLSRIIEQYQVPIPEGCNSRPLAEMLGVFAQSGVAYQHLEWGNPQPVETFVRRAIGGFHCALL